MMKRMASAESRWHEYMSLKASDAQMLGNSRVITGADLFERSVDSFTGSEVVVSVETGLRWKYEEMEAIANQIAHWAVSQNVKAGDVVALLMENRPEFLAITMGVAKVGATLALLNTNVKENQLFHAINVAKPKFVIASSLLKANLQSSMAFFPENQIPQIWWFGSVENFDYLKSQQKKIARLDLEFPKFPKSRPDRKIRETVKPRDPLYYIYTSGTTGLSKAAKFSHARFIGCALTWTRPCGLTANDRYYITLPLFHGNAGCVAVAPCYLVGATIILRQKFSASTFFNDIRLHKCTATIYVGELWRYLQLQPPSPLDQAHSLRVIVGNGLRAEIWENVVKRFNISLVVEHYGATEMPGDAVLNWFNKVGSCGFVPRKAWKDRDAKLIRFNVETETVYRNKDGLCEECQPDEAGEIVFKLPEGLYDGYVGVKETEKKLIKDVFVKGDTWWSSGDLLNMDEEGFFYFIDRVGDTYRWKGENISTSEVSKVLNLFKGIAEANVYGVKVPNTEGRAGMCCLTLEGSYSKQNFDFSSLYSYLKAHLPSYTIPLFLRIRPPGQENEKTSTLKFQKFHYSRQGFNPSEVGNDQLYFCDHGQGTYVPIDEALYKKICSGEVLDREKMAKSLL